MITQHFHLYFERKEPSKNMARFYALSIERDLFGELCLMRRWGRIGARGQTMLHRFGQELDAVAMFLELARRKRARGYRATPVEGSDWQYYWYAGNSGRRAR
ncbi:WGR domain-containing protein [Agrobacterium sp. V1]|uniref:WGR domain-containing protein n=1 Tax=Agrobacterium sp. V1 TaxID=3061957 RepID=UPI00267252D9|nr:WGR domain-containing protein [Agrobacterium sp. V1]MDO3445477.1 WGR domain-containing protein [Agrobacterium sp. V1]